MILQAQERAAKVSGGLHSLTRYGLRSRYAPPTYSSLISLISIILGVGTAIYLEEYASNNAFTQFIKISISNLAGVPSVVFGILGLTIFVRGMGIPGLALSNSVIAAALTMTLLILPVIIVASQEAIRSVPNSVKEASLGLGATKWQTIKNVILEMYNNVE